MTRHNNFVLFVAFAVYAHRDIWPLATYTQNPVDASEGTLLWMKLIVLFATAVIIPLLVPRRYVPVDPKVNTPSTIIIELVALNLFIAPHEGAEP